MKHIFSFPLLFVVIISCSNKDDIPENVLQKEKMQQVLWDVMRADELVTYQFTVDSSINKYSKSVEMYSKVFSMHQINREDFTRSLKFYQDHPNLLQPILDSLQIQAPRVEQTPSIPIQQAQ